MSARLVSFEGGEGAGKSTVIAAVEALLQARGVPFIRTREPGGSPAGEAIRAVLLDPTHSLVPEAELLLMFASRAQLVRSVIEPALAAGYWVLCDRFTDASFAYQGGGRGLDPGAIAELERRFVGRKPDLTILLDVAVDTGLARARGRGPQDRIEQESGRFFERVRAAYRQRAAAEPARFRVIDATPPPDVVAADVCAAVAALLERGA